MRYPRGVAAVCAGVVLATSGAAAVAAEESVTLTGTYRRMAKEVVLGGTTTHAYDDLLVTPSRTYRLRMRGARPAPGSTVRVSANTTGTRDVEVTRTTTIQAAPARATLGPTSTLAILVHWGSPDSLTQASAQSRLFGDTNAWLREVSYGQTSLSGTVTPWLKILPPTGGRCYDYADQIMARARSAASVAGYHYDDYHRTLVYFPRCTGTDAANMTGWAFEPGDSIWLNGVMDRRTSVHEHGHSFGMGHARSLPCVNSTGARVTLSDSCTVSEYGDPYDAMGNSAYAAHYTGYHKDQVGWLGGTRKHVMTTHTATFTLPPFERSSTLPLTVAANGADPGRRYWMEYRQPIGVDSKLPAGATGGVMIHLEDWHRLGSGSHLLDATPSDGTFNNVTLGPGRSWTSPDGVRIAVNSVSTSGASVTVSGARPEPTLPSAPRGLAVTPGHGRALLTWSEPASDGNAPRRRYVVSSSHGPSYTLAPNATSFLLTGLQNGTRYTVSVEAHNDAGAGAEAVTTVTPVASTTPPTVSVTTPVAGATVSGTVNVYATVSADGLLSTLSTKRWYVDGVYVVSGEWFSWDTLGVANGRHTLMAVGYDELDRPGKSEIAVEVFNVRPSVSLTSPAPGARVTGGVVTVTAGAGPSHDGEPVDRVELFVNASRVAVDRTAPYELPWDVTRYTGFAPLVVRAFDTAGRSTTSNPVNVTVYHDPPKVVVTSPVANTTLRGTTLTVTADATPATPGVPISSVTFYSPLGSSIVDTTAPYTATYDTSGFKGYSWVRATATDAAGQTAYSNQPSFTVDNALPAVSVTSPRYDAVIRGTTVTFTGTAARSPAGHPITVTIETPSGPLFPTVNDDLTWTATWNVWGRYGTQRVTAKAVDTHGYTATSSIAFTLERPAPAVTFSAPPDGTLSTTGPSELRAVVVPAADAVHRIVAVCFWDSGMRIGCAEPEPDGTTWVARGLRMPASGDSRWIAVNVWEADGYNAFRAGTYADVYGPPPMPHEATVDALPDATVQVSWRSIGMAEQGRPVDEFVVRDETGAVVARSATSPVTFRPAHVGVEQWFTVEAVNRWGASDRTSTGYVYPVWQTTLSSVRYSRTATTYPGTVTVTARLLRADGQPVAGRPLYAWSEGRDGRWDHWVMPATSLTGFSTLTFTPRATGPVVVAHEYGAGYEYAQSSGTLVTVRALVTATLRSGRIALGATTYLDGRVQSPRPRKFVYLQRFYAGAWRTVTYRAQDSYGRVTVPIKPNARGTYLYRLYWGGDPALSSNVSATRTLYVV